MSKKYEIIKDYNNTSYLIRNNICSARLLFNLNPNRYSFMIRDILEYGEVVGFDLSVKIIEISELIRNPISKKGDGKLLLTDFLETTDDNTIIMLKAQSYYSYPNQPIDDFEYLQTKLISYYKTLGFVSTNIISDLTGCEPMIFKNNIGKQILSEIYHFQHTDYQ
ncbi:MAG: hypothetical protein K9L62_01955 [Vallitaleaceae bacterium]|nr:hypothetical protein [Vallitaleaceae bacterium]